MSDSTFEPQTNVTSTPVDTTTVPSLGDPVNVPVAPVTVPDPALSAPSYTPPSPVASNQDIAALIAQAVQQAMVQQQAQQVAASQPKELTPEEQARVALDNAGYLLGVEERLAELYVVVELLAQKAGI